MPNVFTPLEIQNAKDLAHRLTSGDEGFALVARADLTGFELVDVSNAATLGGHLPAYFLPAASFNPAAFEAAGAVTAGIAAHVALADPHTQYLKEADYVAAVPGGSTTQVQYNNAGAFAGDAGMTYDAANDALTVGRLINGRFRPPANAVDAYEFGDAAGTAIVTVDTVDRITNFASSLRAINATVASSSGSGKVIQTTLTKSVGDGNRAICIENSLQFYGSATQSNELVGMTNIIDSYGSGHISGDAIGMRTAVRHFGTGTMFYAYGMRISSASGSGSIGSMYGLYIDSQSYASVNYAIYTNAGLVRFGGKTMLAAATALAASLNMATGVQPTTPNTGDMWSDGTHAYMYLAGAWRQLDN